MKKPVYSKKISKKSDVSKNILKYHDEDDKKKVIPSTDSVKAYFDSIKKYPLLTFKEEQELAELISKGDMEARCKMIVSNLRLVVNIAKRYLYRGLPLQDLIEEGNIGLIKSVERFKGSRGCKFSTYATYWIRQSVERAVINQSDIVRLPIHLSSDLSKLIRTTRELKMKHDRTPTIEELADWMGVTGRYIKKLQGISRKSLSLDAALKEDSDQNLFDRIEDESIPPVYELIDIEKRANEIRKWLDELEANEKEVLTLRFGLDGEPQTLECVGKKFGVTRERIRQIEAKALKKLKNLIAEMNITSSDSI